MDSHYVSKEIAITPLRDEIENYFQGMSRRIGANFKIIDAITKILFGISFINKEIDKEKIRFPDFSSGSHFIHTIFIFQSTFAAIFFAL